MEKPHLQAVNNVFELFSAETDDARGKVTMSNRLARATHQLTLYELRVVYLALTKAKSYPGRESALTLHKNEGWRVTLQAQEYAETFGLTLKAGYVQLRGVVKGLMEKKVRRVLSRNAVGQEHYEEFIWVQYACYNEAAHTIEVLFSAPVTPHLLGLKDHFTLFLLRHVSGLDSSYAVALYRNLKSWADMRRWAPTLEEFWEAMEVPEDSSYRRDFKALRLRIIEPAVASINAKTDLHLEWRPIKAGQRKVSSIDFRFVAAKDPLKAPGMTPTIIPGSDGDLLV